MGASVYKASAGAGKTYLLVQHYLAYVLQPHHRFEQALAVTFTNKAAGEMKARIMDMLHQLAEGRADEAYVQQLQAIMADKPNYRILTGEAIQRQAKNVRADILHRYAQFAVGTIDAFFQRILRSFAQELNVSVNYNLELDTESVLREITERLLEKLTDNEELAHWLLAFMEEKLAEGKSWNLEKDLLDFSWNLLHPKFQSLLQQLNSSNASLRTIMGQLKKDLWHIKHQFEEEMKRIGREGTDMLAQHNLSVEDGYYKDKGPLNYLNKIQEGQFEYGSRVNQVRNGDYTVFGKNPKDSKAQLAPELDALVVAAADYFDDHYIDYHSAALAMQYLNQLGILTDMASLLNNYRDEEEVVLIDDTNRLLASITAETDTPFLYEKVGQQYKFYLLDEFQDTSDRQWRNFLPLLSNALASGEEVLVVGDIKQSIYRWRGGNMELLREYVPQSFSAYPNFVDTPITTNWRSLPAIVHFNNAFFTQLPKAVATDERAHFNSVPAFTELFADVEQHPMRKAKQEGFVQVDMVPFDKEADEEDHWRQALLSSLPEQINSILADGYDGRDICFLVDTNADGALLAQFLSQQGYDVISQDSLLLGNSTAVQLVVQTLQWIQQPDEPLLRSQLLHTFLQWKQVTLSDRQQLLQKGDRLQLSDIPNFPPPIRTHRKQWLNLPLYDLVEHIIQAYGLDQQGDAFIVQFQDKVLAFAQEQSQVVAAFLEWWADKGVKEPLHTTATTDAMQIMTIHKAKGLQFPVVMIPLLHLNLEPKIEPLLWVDTPPQSPYKQIPYLPIRYRKPKGETYFDDTFKEEQVLSAADQLNKWYVAFTRAADRLYVQAPVLKSKPPDSTTLLSTILKGDAQIDGAVFAKYWVEDRGRFQYGAPTPLDKQKKQPPTATVSVSARTPWHHRLSLRATERTIQQQEWQTANGQLHKGRIIHEWLSRLEDTHEAHTVLRELIQEGWCSANEEKELQVELSKILNDKRLQSWFDREWTSFTERDILLPGGATQRPDRVLIRGREAKLLDYKTGMPRESDQAQVRTYADALQRMGYQVIDAQLFYTQNQEWRKVDIA